MSIDLSKLTPETEAKMAILGFTSAYFIRHGRTPEVRKALLQALAEVAACELCLSFKAEDREHAILTHCEDVARATEERFLQRRKRDRRSPGD